MIGEKVEFKDRVARKVWCKIESKDVPPKAIGKVMDKISGTSGSVARGWAISAGSNNVAVQNSYTYYLIADTEGNIHSVYPSDIIKIIT